MTQQSDITIKALNFSHEADKEEREDGKSVKISPFKREGAFARPLRFMLNPLGRNRAAIEIPILDSVHDWDRTFIRVADDQAYQFELHLSALAHVSLSHQGELIHFEEAQVEDDYIIYRWRAPDIAPNRPYYLFYNHYGRTTLSLRINHQEILLAPLEIVNRNAKHEQATFMLDTLKRESLPHFQRLLKYRAHHKDSQLEQFLRLERQRIDQKRDEESAETPEYYLNYFQSLLEPLSQLIERIIRSPLKDRSPRYREVVPHSEMALDDDSIQWLIDHLDTLFEVSSPEEALLKYRGRYYSAPKVGQLITTPNFDIEENRAIISALLHLLNRIDEVIDYLSTHKSAPNRSEESGEYRAFSSELMHSYHKESDQLSRALLAIKEPLLKQVHLLGKRWGLPLRLGRLRKTAKMRHRPAYLALLSLLENVEKPLKIAGIAPQALLEINSIPELFEYYLFFKMAHYIKTINKRGRAGFYIDENEVTFELTIGDYQYRLEYEPYIGVRRENRLPYAHPHLVNVEGYYLSDGILKQRHHHSRQHHRLPDFLLSVTHLNDEKKRRHYIVMDAKFTDPHLAFTRDLPELTMKYLHGIHDGTQHGDLDHHPIKGVAVIHPDESSTLTHFHGQPYTSFGGAYTISPYLITIGHPLDEEVYQRTDHPYLMQVLARSIKLLRRSLNKEQRIERALALLAEHEADL